MKRIKLLGLFVILLVAITSSGQQLRHIRTGNYEGVVDLRTGSQEHSVHESPKYIPDNRTIAKIEKVIKQMTPSLADQYRALNPFAHPECSIKQILKSYKRYYSGYYRFGYCFVNVNFYKKLPDERSIMGLDSVFMGNCPHFFLRYDFQKDTLDVICPDDQTIEIDRVSEQLKQEPNRKEQLK